MSLRQEKIAELLMRLTAQFLQVESGGQSLMSATSCHVSTDLKSATIFISVYPDTKEAAALDFAKRKRTELRTFIKKNTKLKLLPFIDIEIDKGEKNRQRIDELFREQ